MDQGRQRTQKLKTPTVLESEHLRLDDQTIEGTLLSSLAGKAKRGLLRQSFRAGLHAACTTAIISGPRYGSTVTTPACGRRSSITRRRQYTPRVTLFPKREKNVSTSEARLYEVPDTCFRIGNTRRSPVLYRVKHDKPTWGAVRKQWQVLPRFLRRALRGRSQAKGPVTTPSRAVRPYGSKRKFHNTN